MTPSLSLTDGRYRLARDEELGLVMVDDLLLAGITAAGALLTSEEGLALAIPETEPYAGSTAPQTQAIRAYLMGRYTQQYAEQIPQAIEEHLPAGGAEGFPSETAKHLAEVIVSAWLAKQAVHTAAAGFAPLLAAMAVGAGVAGIALAQITHGTTDDEALQRWARRRASWALPMMDDTVGQEVSNFLTQELQQTSAVDDVISAYHERFLPAGVTTPQTKAERATRSEARDAYNFGMLTTLQRLGVPRVLAHDASDGTDTKTDLLCQQRNGQIYSVDEAIRQATSLTHPNDTLYFTPIAEASLVDDVDADLELGWSEAARESARLSREAKRGERAVREKGYAQYLVDATKGMDTRTAKAKLTSGELMDTKTWHERNGGGRGKFSASRKAVHRESLSKYLRGARTQAHPEAVFTGGGGASGKDSLVKLLPTPKGHVYINPDNIKHDLPEFRELAKLGRGDLSAGATHEESSMLSKQLANKAIGRKAHVVIDGVGDSGPKKFVQKIDEAHKAGYSIHIRYAMTPLDQALGRAKKRFENEVKRTGVGRDIDPDELAIAHKAVSERYINAVKKLKYAHITIHNTSNDINQGDVPPVIAEKPAESGRVKVYNPEKYQDFLSKASAE